MAGVGLVLGAAESLDSENLHAGWRRPGGPAEVRWAGLRGSEGRISEKKAMGLLSRDTVCVRMLNRYCKFRLLLVFLLVRLIL